jgi:hypothetical protein
MAMNGSMKLRTPTGVAVLLAVGMLIAATGAAAAVESTTWQEIIESITQLSDLAVLQDAVEILTVGGPEAEILKADPGTFLRESGLPIGGTEDPSGSDVLLIDMTTNKALTPAAQDLATSGAEDFRLSEVAIAFIGPTRGLIVQRRIPIDAPEQTFEEMALSINLFLGESMDFLANTVHEMEMETDPALLEFFFEDPEGFVAQRAYEQRVLGTAITFDVIEQSNMTAFDIGLDEDAKFQADRIPLAEPGTVSIALGYATGDWSLFVKLVTKDGFPEG